jgi:hypothetical protein
MRGWAEKLLTEPIPGTHRISTRFPYLLSRYLAMFPSRLYGITAITGYVTLQGPIWGPSCHLSDGRMARCCQESLSTVVSTEIHKDHRRPTRCIQRKPSVLLAFIVRVLALIIRVPASIVRAGHSKCVHFVISDSRRNIPIPRSPIEDGVHD